MANDEPTLPNLRVQRTAGAPTWPHPRPQSRRTEGLPIWGVVLLFMVVALLSFGVVRGMAVVLAQHNISITIPSQPFQPSHSSGAPALPTVTPTSMPVATPTETAQPIETAQPTPTSSGGGD